jgi:Uma2 family endonuclease
MSKEEKYAVGPEPQDDLPADSPITVVGDLPLMFEDNGQEEMGEGTLHTEATYILRSGLIAHLTRQPRFHVFSDLDLHYHPGEQGAYVSPDAMVAEPVPPWPFDFPSYRIGVDGPVPRFVAEVLSQRSRQQGDLTVKPAIYARLGIPEYLLVDLKSEFLPQRLVLRRLQADATWKDEQDSDGGVTSRLGFRVVPEADGLIAVWDARMNKRYYRPGEVQALVDRVRELEKELARLRGKGRKRKGS